MSHPDYFYYENFTIEITYYPAYDRYSWEAFKDSIRLQMFPRKVLQSQEAALIDAQKEILFYLLP